MKRLVFLLALIVAVALPTGAAAHPLGNFSVNRFSELAASGERIYVRYVLDLAEIPTAQEGDRVRASSFPAEVARGLVLELDGRRASLRVLDARVVERPGAGGLATLRFEAVYEADREGSSLVFRDSNFGGRIGWREVVATASDGAALVASDVPATSRSGRLTAYPDELLRSPLEVTTARVRVEPGEGPGTPPALGEEPAAGRENEGFASLVSRDDLGLGVVLVSLAIALFWGAAHALTPGHGKAIVAGYLVGTRGTPRHAVLLGLIVTVTHTAGVFALGLVTLLLSQFFVPERLYPWLALASGLLVVAVGASVLAKRIRHGRAHRHGHHHHDHDHDHARAAEASSASASQPGCFRARRLSSSSSAQSRSIASPSASR